MGTNLKFLCEMKQSIQTFSTEIMRKMSQDESFLFFFLTKRALLKDTIRAKSSLFVGHCLFIQVTESCRYLQQRCGWVSCMRGRSPIFEYQEL